MTHDERLNTALIGTTIGECLYHLGAWAIGTEGKPFHTDEDMLMHPERLQGYIEFCREQGSEHTARVAEAFKVLVRTLIDVTIDSELAEMAEGGAHDNS